MGLVYLLLLWEFVLLVLVMVITSFDYTCPSFLTLVMFTISTLSLAFNQWKWNVEFHFMTFLIISSGLATVVLVDAIISDRFRKLRGQRDDGGFEVVKDEKPYVSGNVMKMIILFSSLLMMLLYLRDVRSIGNAFSIGSLISSIGAVQQERHMGAVATICLRLGYALSNLYAFLFCHNVLVSHEKIRKNIYLLIAMFAGIISTFFSGSRSLLLGVIFAFLFY